MKIWDYIHSKELILTLLLIACVVLYINPMHLYMFTRMQMYILGMLVFGVALFAAFVVNERISDERERMHTDLAGRIGYTVGIIMLTIKILIDNSLGKDIDNWLVLTLLIMIVSKVLTRVWSRVFK